MNNPQSYVNHILNTSATKQTFSFPRQQRFKAQRRSVSDIMYEIPSSMTRRSCSFGYGNKLNLAEKQKSPPPGTYESRSDFDGRVTKYNTISFSIGRNKVKFGSFLAEADGRKNMPSPTAYRIKTNYLYSKKGGKMAAKLPTQIDLLTKKRTPGPGTYKLDITQMRGTGSYVLSNYTNNISPKYLSPDHQSRSRSPSNRYKTLGPGQYDISHDKFGQSLLSKFKNSTISTFGRQKRPGMEDKSKIKFPGFKYKKFSQFCGEQK